MADLPVVFVDLETTGLSADEDRVIELALIADDWVIDTLVRPDCSVPLGGCHGLDAADLADAPTFAEIAPLVRQALAGRMLVGHFVAFDLAFLEAEFIRLGEPLGDIPTLCTAGLAEMLDLGHEQRRLSYACERHDVVLVEPHVAHADARAAGTLFEIYAELARGRGTTLVDLAAVAPISPMVRTWATPPRPPGERFVRANDLRLTARRSNHRSTLP